MPGSRLVSLSICLSATLLFSNCAPAPNSPPADGSGGNTSSSGGSTGSGGSNSSSSGGSNGSSSGGSNGSSSGGSNGSSSGGQLGSGSGGTTGSGASVGSGGKIGSGGTTGSGGAGTSSGGATSSGGTTGSGGSTGSGGATMPTTDQNGKGLAKPGDMTMMSKDYLNLGDMRLINNRWGSDALNCGGTQQSVSINSDGSFGWTFNRPTCGGMKGDPDFPEVEFGVAPFGRTSSLLTTPAFSSTKLLPIQIKNLKSATANIDTFNSNFQKPTYWDSNFEFWISKQDPTQNDNAGVYAEIIAFVGWQSDRLSKPNGWPCDKSGNVTAGGSSFNLCHQSDTWSNGQWRFFNFNVNNGPMSTFNSNVDIKAMLDWVMQNYSGFTTDMWLTRIEVGTEVDDNTQGTGKINNLTFEINGESRSAQFAK